MIELIEQPDYQDYCGSCGRTLTDSSYAQATQSLLEAVDYGWRLRCVWSALVALTAGLILGVLL